MKIEEILTVEVRSNSEIEEILTTGATHLEDSSGDTPPRKNARRLWRRGHQGILNRESLKPSGLESRSAAECIMHHSLY